MSESLSQEIRAPYFIGCHERDSDGIVHVDAHIITKPGVILQHVLYLWLHQIPGFTTFSGAEAPYRVVFFDRTVVKVSPGVSCCDR